MRLLANENIPLASIAALRSAGHDVTSLSETSPGISDEAVLDLARKQQRIVVTFDRDYGTLIYGQGLASPPGVVYLRFVPKTPVETAEILLALLAQSGDTLDGHFFVVEHDSFRRRPLPGTTGTE